MSTANRRSSGSRTASLTMSFIVCLTLIFASLQVEQVEAALPALPTPVDCDWLEEAWTTCLSDWRCRTVWFLDGGGDATDRALFEYLLPRYIVGTLGLSAADLNVTCPGAPASSLRLPLLRQARWCGENEEPDPLDPSGCRCRFDRVCREASPLTAAADTLSFYVAVALALAVFIFFAVQQSQLLRRFVAGPMRGTAAAAVVGPKPGPPAPSTAYSSAISLPRSDTKLRLGK